ncbi:DapH/DapD/GlmU-related protein [Nitratidesulfovibrio liaohensis]|uniref:Sugar transferase n=1 Tax=Nitratidesulfovibrio liaohensis TaxID=2604158 RepID=A0ABY9R0Q1_9BACT|nr:DapH/DapD/GlmU-related protein [Nitratidesulfovibrio liaohensis]WMW65044.1 hypothetical protein KPS_003138 [Nitratidesulfovibrio liaohensis]
MTHTSQLAPVILFVYARPDHTRKTIDALRKNHLANDTNLIIYSDAAHGPDDLEAVNAVREYIKTVKGFKSVTINEREKNYGLAESIACGVTETINTHGAAIVIEDDIVTSTHFLDYMNEALRIYAADDRVMHIAGHMPNVDTNDLPETFFMRQSSCWGWGTWARAWKHFHRNSTEIIQHFSPQDIHRFNLDGSVDYWSQFLANHNGQLKTWAVYWYACVFLKGGLCLHPRTSLVNNIGHDGSGTNCGINPHHHCAPNTTRIKNFDSPLTENQEALKRYRNAIEFSTHTMHSTLGHKADHRLKKILKSLYMLVINYKKAGINTTHVLAKLKSRIQRIINKILSSFTACKNKKTHTDQITIGKNSLLLPTARINNIHGRHGAIRIGEYTHVRGELTTFGHGGAITIGDYCYIGEGTRIWSAESINIGNRVLISHNVNIFDNDTHPIEDPAARHAQFVNIITTGHPKQLDLNEDPIIIEDDVLIACQSIILSGVRIGHGAVVAAGSVVTKSVPPRTLVAGNPARVVKTLNKTS